MLSVVFWLVILSNCGVSGGEEPELLVRQNQDLRRRLDEESQSYKRRLDTYKQAQTHQAALISRLQAKILQYKQRCTGWWLKDAELKHERI